MKNQGGDVPQFLESAKEKDLDISQNPMDQSQSSQLGQSLFGGLKQGIQGIATYFQGSGQES